MRFYLFGDENKPVILLLPGTCCTYKRNFGTVIPLLMEHFYVVCASYGGFDETEDSIFIDMEHTLKEIEDYIKQNFQGAIFAAYGCSMGGSLVSLLVERENVHINHAILGSSDMDQSGPLAARLQGKIVSSMIYKIFQTGKLPGILQRRWDKKSLGQDPYYVQMFKMFGLGSTDLRYVKKQSIYNQFTSDLITPVGMQIDVAGTQIHIFYATKMGEKYEERYRAHFKHPDIRYHDYQHEELLVCYPKEWASQVCSCCDIELNQSKEESL
jgi:hypothetical protein